MLTEAEEEEEELEKALNCGKQKVEPKREDLRTKGFEEPEEAEDDRARTDPLIS